jgi:hypothetical protein
MWLAERLFDMPSESSGPFPLAVADFSVLCVSDEPL